MRLRRGMGVVAALGIAAACTDLRSASPGADEEDGGVGVDDDASSDAASVPDVREAAVEQPPPDSLCSEAWTVDKKSEAGCAPRRVTTFDIATTGTLSLDLAVTPARRVGIVTNRKGANFEDGVMIFVTFPATSSPPPALPQILTRNGLQPAQTFEFMEAGHLAAITSVGPNTFGIFSHDVEYGAAGDIVYLEHAPSDVDLVERGIAGNNVAAFGSLSASSDGKGRAYLAYLARPQPSLGTIKFTTRGPSDTTFTPLPDLDVDIVLGGAPVGRVSLGMLDTGEPHAAYHFAVNKSSSSPRYRQYAGTAWVADRTFAPTTAGGQHGYYPRLASFGSRRWATYFSRPPEIADAGPATASLMIATWEGGTGATTQETLATGLRADSEILPRFDADLALDRFGLVHIAWVEPGSDTVSGRLFYRRQTRAADGALSWLEEVVDSDVTNPGRAGKVAIAVDTNARPHIAYLGADGKLHYATRYDR